MIAAPLAGWLALRFGDRKLLFLIFGSVSLISIFWLYCKWQQELFPLHFLLQQE